MALVLHRQEMDLRAEQEFQEAEAVAEVIRLQHSEGRAVSEASQEAAPDTAHQPAARAAQVFLERAAQVLDNKAEVAQDY